MAGKMAQLVADPYAEALIALAQSQNSLDQFGTEIRLLLTILRSTPELKPFLENPVVQADAKKTVLQQAFAKRVNPLILNTLLLLTDRRRIMFLESLCLRFLEIQRKLQKIALAEVTSAVELSLSQQEAIQQRVKQLAQAERVELETQVDPSLIGGFIIKVGSQVIDMSLKGQLRRFALQLA